jgi:hypothetical protein
LVAATIIRPLGEHHHGVVQSNLIGIKNPAVDGLVSRFFHNTHTTPHRTFLLGVFSKSKKAAI